MGEELIRACSRRWIPVHGHQIYYYWCLSQDGCVPALCPCAVRGPRNAARWALEPGWPHRETNFCLQATAQKSNCRDCILGQELKYLHMLKQNFSHLRRFLENCCLTKPRSSCFWVEWLKTHIRRGKVLPQLPARWICRPFPPKSD